MREMLFPILFTFILGATPRYAPAPIISVVSQQKCGSEVFAVLQVSNPDKHRSLFFPLSPLHNQGYTVDDLRLEVLEDGQWSLVGRGSDALSSGVRELKPGERFIDFFQLPTPDRGVALVGLPKRVVVPYIVGNSHRKAKTKDFTDVELPTDDKEHCPRLP